MFEQSIIAGGPKKRRAWTVSVSIAGQIAAVAVAVLIPVVAYDHLPAARLAPRLGLPQAPGPKARPRPAHVSVVDVKWQMRHGQLVEPAPDRIPAHPQMIVDPTPPSDTRDTGPWVEGGIEGADANADSVVGQLLKDVSRQAQQAAQPPVVKEPTPAAVAQIQRIRLGGRVLEAKLIRRVIPVYPAPARTVRAAGNVELRAVISRDGHIQEIRVLSGHPLLIQAAVEAVRQWVYQPTLLNGEPVEVDTVITLTFTLAR